MNNLQTTIRYATIKEKNRTQEMKDYIDNIVSNISKILGDKESTDEAKELAIKHGDILNDAHGLMGIMLDGVVYNELMDKYINNK